MALLAAKTWTTVPLVLLWSIQFGTCARSRGLLFTAQNPYCPAEILWSRTLRSTIACAIRCSGDTQCNGVVFNTDTGQCVGHSDDTQSGTGCEPPAGSIHYEIACPAEYTLYKPTGVCFRISTSCMTWQDGRDVCQQDGGDLIVLKDAEFLTFFTNQLIQSAYVLCGTGVWIGATDTVNEDQFTWVDGSEMDQAAVFDPSEPNGSIEEQCAILFQQILFLGGDVSCSTLASYACGIYF